MPSISIARGKDFVLLLINLFQLWKMKLKDFLNGRKKIWSEKPTLSSKAKYRLCYNNLEDDKPTGKGKSLHK